MDEIIVMRRYVIPTDDERSAGKRQGYHTTWADGSPVFVIDEHIIPELNEPPTEAPHG